MNLHRAWVSTALNDMFSGSYGTARNTGAAQFKHLCNTIQSVVMAELTEEHKEDDYGAKAQHDALIGKPDSVRYFKNKIARYLKERKIGNVEYPNCYKSLVDAVYNEVWGYSVLAEWFDMPESQSAKVIGDQVFYMMPGGRQVKQPYTIPDARRKQLKDNLLLNVQGANTRTKNVEMNLLTGERVSIFGNRMTKEGKDVIVFRKYTVNSFTWEEQAKRKTIPMDSVDFMKCFCRVGYNVLIVGPVRSGKTTLLGTWMSYEDPSLEGVTIEATDEMQFDDILPGSPIMQLYSDEDNIGGIVKPVLRSDADYLVLAEARRGEEFELMVRLANKGTGRCKTTLHSTHVKELMYDITDEILSVRPNSQYKAVLMKTALAFNYVIQIQALYNDKSQKRIAGIFEIFADRAADTIEMFKICEYDPDNDSWKWAYHISDDKREIARRENFEAFRAFEIGLKELAKRYPMENDNRIVVYDGGHSND